MLKLKIVYFFRAIRIHNTDTPKFRPGRSPVRRIVGRSKLNIRTFNCISTYKGVQVTHCNLIGRSMTAPPPVLTPSSIFPPHSYDCALISAFGGRFKKCTSTFYFFFLIFNIEQVRNCVIEISVSREVSVAVHEKQCFTQDFRDLYPCTYNRGVKLLVLHAVE